jgi:hypothetical protein
VLLSTIVIIPLIVSEILKKLFTTILPVSFISHTSSFATIDQALSTLHYLGGRGAAMLGIDLLGREPLKPSTIAILVTMLVLVVAIRGSIRERQLYPKNFFINYYLLLWIWIPLLLVISSLGVQPGSSRYIILLVFLVPLGLIFAMARFTYLRQTYLIVVLTLFSLLVSLHAPIKALISTKSHPNADNFATIKLLKDLHLTKGYTRFWDASIDTYLSDHQITFIPAECNAETQTLKVGSVLFERTEIQKKAHKSFYLYVPDNDMRSCSPDALVTTLGEPSKVIDAPVAGEKIAIYDYDITSVLIKN